MHNRVVFRAARVLASAGWSTLRFNFRGVGLSDGLYDAGKGETDDCRAALDEAERQGGRPLLAGGFSFGAAAALRAIHGDPRVVAYVAVGLPVATDSVAATPRPSVPALFVVGERDVYGPPDRLADFVSDSGQIAVVPAADHFLDGNLEQLDTAIPEFLASLPTAAARR
jgi:alpha/beta superfamily hydrolase